MSRRFTTETVIFTCIFVIILSKDVYSGSLCDEPGTSGLPVPSLPKFYSTNIQVNDKISGTTSEVFRIVDATKDSDSTEVWTDIVHIKYINSDKSFLTLKYGDEGVTCTKTDSKELNRHSVYLRDKAAPLDILDILEYKIIPKTNRFQQTNPNFVDGIPVLQWTFCDYVEELDADVKVIISFSAPGWIPFYAKQKINEYELVHIEVLSDEENADIDVNLHFYNYKPFPPADNAFQVPDLVHCPDYRSDKQIPDLPVYFSYKSEKIQYVSPSGVQPTVFHTEIHYDTKSGLARVNFENPSNKDTAIIESIIYDFNLGVQYSTDPNTGGCVMDLYDRTFDSISTIKTATNSILDTKQYFNLDGIPLSYNGKYEARGIVSDVFSGVVTRDGEKRETFWYFSSDRASIIEGGMTEKNVLLKMVNRPVPANGKQDQVELNFYDFKHEEPNVEFFDISMCFNESLSKYFVMSFSVKKEELMKESLPALKSVIHQAIRKEADVSRHRIVMHETYFFGDKLITLFILLDLPPIRGSKPAPKESDLETASNKLQEAVNGGNFKPLFLSSSEKEIRLVADTLKEIVIKSNPEEWFQGPTYKEGSVVGVAIGMTILGFLLGAVVINLIISKKYGVSLLQKSGFVKKGARAFNNPLNESGI